MLMDTYFTEIASYIHSSKAGCILMYALVYWCTHCNFHCGGGNGGCIYLCGGMVAGYYGWIVVSRSTCGCCSAPA